MNVIQEAGQMLMRYFGNVGLAHASFKGGYAVNLVSRADAEAQNLIVNKIKKEFPQDLILAEEGDLAKLEYSARELARNFLWVIDPLDGTVNFLHGYPLFAVSIALIWGGQPVAGAIFDPTHKELFWAQKSRGAVLNGKRIFVTKTAKLADSLMVTGFAYDRREKADFYLSYYKRFLSIAHDVRRTGSACIDLAWLAAGRYDGFWELHLNPWDVAAGVLLVQEALGQVTRFDNSAYDIFRSDETLATNGKIHKDCLKILKRG